MPGAHQLGTIRVPAPGPAEAKTRSPRARPGSGGPDEEPKPRGRSIRAAVDERLDGSVRVDPRRDRDELHLAVADVGIRAELDPHLLADPGLVRREPKREVELRARRRREEQRNRGDGKNDSHEIHTPCPTARGPSFGRLSPWRRRSSRSTATPCGRRSSAARSSSSSMRSRPWRTPAPTCRARSTSARARGRSRREADSRSRPGGGRLLRRPDLRQLRRRRRAARSSRLHERTALLRRKQEWREAGLPLEGGRV